MDIESEERSATYRSWLREVTAWSQPDREFGRVAKQPLHCGLPLKLVSTFSKTTWKFSLLTTKKRKESGGGEDRDHMAQGGSVRNCSFLRSNGTHSLAPGACPF